MSDKSAQHRITTALSIGLLGELFNKIAPLLIIRHAQARLGIEMFGQAQFAMAIIDMVVPFIAFGYSTLAAMEIGRQRDNREAIGTIIGNVTILRLINALVVFLGLNGIMALLPQYAAYAPLVYILSFMLFTSAIDMLFVHTGTQKVSVFSSLTIVAKLLSLAAIYYFVRQPSDGNLYGMISCGANSLISISSAVYFLRKYPFRWNTREFWPLCKRAIPYALNFVLLSLLFRYDLILAEYFGGSTAAGLYVGPTALMRSLISVAGAVTLVFFSEMLVAATDAEFNKRIHQTFWVLGALMFPIAVGIWWVDHEVLELIMGPAFTAQGPVLSTLVATVLMYNILYVLGFQILAVKGRIHSVNAALATACLCGMVVGAWLGRSYGLLGIALSFGFANLVGTLMCLRQIRSMAITFPKDALFRTATPAALMGIGLFLLPRSSLFMTGLVACVLYASFFALFNRKALNQFSKFLRRLS